MVVKESPFFPRARICPQVCMYMYKRKTKHRGITFNITRRAATPSGSASEKGTTNLHTVIRTARRHSGLSAAAQNAPRVCLLGEINRRNREERLLPKQGATFVATRAERTKSHVRHTRETFYATASLLPCVTYGFIFLYHRSSFLARSLLSFEM